MPVNYYAEEMELFWKYIAERHTIYKKKELQKLPPPWTEDQILRSFKFTCVFRELDRGTKFVTNHVLTRRMSRTNTLFNVIVYRLFNKIETYLAHGPLDVNKYEQKALRDLLWKVSLDNKVFTNAFTVSGYSQYGCGLDKITRLSLLLQDLVNKLKKDDADGTLDKCVFKTDKMEDAYWYLRTVSGIGPFLGYQIAVDLSYWKVTLFGEDDFVVDGPGARRGLQWLFPEEEIKAHGYEWLNFWLRDNQASFWKDYGIDHVALFDDRPAPVMTVMALENGLCEISKYLKAYYSQGRPRNTYDEAAGYEREQDPVHKRYC
jgi:hypothetical protein